MEVGKNTWPLTILCAVLFVFLLAPVLMVLPASFSNDNFLVFPPEQWGIRYYERLLLSEDLKRALFVSLVLGGIVTALSLLIAIPAAYALIKSTIRSRDILLGLLTAPLLLPSIVLGLAMLLVFVRLDLLATFPGLVLAHLIVTLPYALRIMATSMTTLPPDLEDAAATLGASDWLVFRRVTLPLMRRDIIAAAALCFIVSFDEVVISLFIVGPKLTTLPVELYRSVETRADPLTAAASVVLIVATMAVVLVLERTVGVARALGQNRT